MPWCCWWTRATQTCTTSSTVSSTCCPLPGTRNTPTPGLGHIILPKKEIHINVLTILGSSILERISTYCLYVVHIFRELFILSPSHSARVFLIAQESSVPCMGEDLCHGNNIHRMASCLASLLQSKSTAFIWKSCEVDAAGGWDFKVWLFPVLWIPCIIDAQWTNHVPSSALYFITRLWLLSAFSREQRKHITVLLKLFLFDLITFFCVVFLYC